MKIDKIISLLDRNKIKEAVERAERKTSGEIMPAVAERSDFYGAARWEIAFIFSLLLTFTFYIIVPNLILPFYLLAEIAFLFIGFLVARIDPLLRIFIHKNVMLEEVHQKALETFLEHNLHTTEKRNGILIFVSLLERRIEIIADVGIHEKTTSEFWTSLVDEMVLYIKSGDPVGGFTNAILKCGDHLSKEFPADRKKRNEIKDDLVVE